MELDNIKFLTKQNQNTEHPVTLASHLGAGGVFYCLLLPRKKALEQNCESSDSKPYSCTAATGLSYSTKVGGGGLGVGRNGLLILQNFGCTRLEFLFLQNQLKGHGNEADFLGFLQKLVPHESLTLPFGPFRFWLRIRGDICIRKTTPRYHLWGESPTLRSGDTGSRQLSVAVIRGVADSRIIESGNRRLPASLIRGVGDSPHHPYGESAIYFFKENSLYQ